MQVQAIKTQTFSLGEAIEPFLLQHLDSNGGLKENQILCITSKIISLSENKIVSKNQISKRDLVKQEADIFLAESIHDVFLTIKHGLMIPSAGIDESNADGDFYILYPENPFQSAKRIWGFLKSHYNLKNLGIILTDSHTQPLRRGVTGVALSYWGFSAVKDLRGDKDLFGKELKYTAVHVADAIAAGAVLAMGESNDSKPLAVVSEVDVNFTDTINPSEGVIPPEQDLYFCLYKSSIKS